MDLGQGEIYFIAERDGSSNTGFIKIGLVRERDGRDSYDRIKEHQTGNPRSLELLNVVKTVLVSTVENTLHREYAGRRVSGEWFKLDQPALADAVARCTVLAETYAAHLPTLQSANAYDQSLSVPITIMATDESRAWQLTYLRAKNGSRIIDSAHKRFQKFLEQLHEAGVEVIQLVTFEDAKGRQLFDDSSFKERFPALWQQHLVRSTSIPQPRNRVVSLPDNEVGESDAVTETRVIATRLEEFQQSGAQDPESLNEMHSLFLQLLSLEALFTEQEMLAEAYLKAFCALNEGIEGVYKWKRVEEVKESLDKGSLKEHFPSEYQQFTSQAAATRRIKIRRSSVDLGAQRS